MLLFFTSAPVKRVMVMFIRHFCGVSILSHSIFWLTSISRLFSAPILGTLLSQMVSLCCHCIDRPSLCNILLSVCL
ncbi:hypothetical protein V1507DRAFT_463225 [Lipomyces tetrasporus]